MPLSDTSNADTGPHLRYMQDGRDGTIQYCSPQTCFDMWFELALPPAVVIIGIPEPKHWVQATQLPLSQREATLAFIGQQVVSDKLSGAGYVEYTDNILTICRGAKP